MKSGKILVLCDYYLPGYRAGGPIRTISNLVDWFNEEFNFYILTSDRDFLSTEKYKDIEMDTWLTSSTDKRLYSSKDQHGFLKLRKKMNSIDFDTVYINSFFSFRFSIMPLVLRKMKLIAQTPVILAPRGEFGEGALAIKSGKKKLFLLIAKLTGLHSRVVWQATNQQEALQIKQIFGQKADINITSNLSKKVMRNELSAFRRVKRKGELKILFVGRVCEIKNIDFAIQCLIELSGNILFDIYGPKEDLPYWNSCLQLIKELPEHVEVNYRGEIENHKLGQLYPQYHLMFSPTKGENFGHSIFESLSCATPVLISDRTPWLNLAESKAGWDLSLKNKTAYTRVLHDCINMNQEEYDLWSTGAFDKAIAYIEQSSVIDSTRRLFNGALGK